MSNVDYFLLFSLFNERFELLESGCGQPQQVYEDFKLEKDVLGQ